MKKIKNTMIICFLLIMLISLSSFAVLASEADSQIITMSLINQDPDPAISGDVVEVRLGVENSGGVAAENIMLEILPQYPFLAVAGEELVKEVGTLKAYQYDADMKIIKFKVRVDRDASAGEYELKVKQYDKDNPTFSSVRSIAIDIKSKESAEVIHIDKTILIPGREDSLKFTINNVGNTPLRDLTFSWVNDDQIILPVGSDNTKYIRYIDVGEGTEIEYKVIADTNVDAGLYVLDLTLIYDDPITGAEKEINTIAGVYVGGGSDFDIAFSETSSGQTSFTIANIGSNPASSVSVIVPEQSGWSVTGSSSMIIGNLNTGDYTVASFALSSTGTTRTVMQQAALQDDSTTNDELSSRRAAIQSSSNALKIQIAYTDTMGKREIIEKEVVMSSQASASSSDSSDTKAIAAGDLSQFARMRQQTTQQSFFLKYKWYITVFIVVLIVAFGLWRYKQAKTMDPDAKLSQIFSLKNLLKKKKR